MDANETVSIPELVELAQYVPATELHAPVAENGRLETYKSGSPEACGVTEMARSGQPASWALLREKKKKSSWPAARDETRADAW